MKAMADLDYGSFCNFERDSMIPPSSREHGKPAVRNEVRKIQEFFFFSEGEAEE